MDLPNIYKGDYRRLIIPPLILILLSIYFIPQIKMGVDFTGGTLITLTLDGKIDGEQLKADLAAEGLKADVRVFDTAVGYKAEIEFPQSQQLLSAEKLRENFTGMIAEASELETLAQTNSSYTTKYAAKRAEIDAVAGAMFALAGDNRKASSMESVNDLQKAFNADYQKVYDDYEKAIAAPINKYVKYDSISVQTVSPVLTAHFMDIALKVVIASAVLSVAFVFLFFRDFVPSVAVLLGALSDIIIAMGAMGLFGIPFTLPAFATLLMLIGFSLDTDILLTMRMLKRRGDPREKAYESMKTGLTMSVTAMVSFGVLFVLASLTHIPTYYEISAVALAGLVGDMFATWGINGVLLLWDVERKEASGSGVS